jgi:hypothetical protein
MYLFIYVLLCFLFYKFRLQTLIFGDYAVYLKVVLFLRLQHYGTIFLL